MKKTANGCTCSATLIGPCLKVAADAERGGLPSPESGNWVESLFRLWTPAKIILGCGLAQKLREAFGLAEKNVS